MNLFLATLLASWVGLAATTHPREPYIEHQESIMVLHQFGSPTWERNVVVSNPRRRATVVNIECVNLTVNPIVVLGKRSSTITLPGVPPGDGCSIANWTEQRPKTRRP